MFGTVLTTVVTALHLYVFCRASSVPQLTRFLPKRFLVSIGALLWGFFLIGRLYGHDNAGFIAGCLEQLSMTWMAALFLCTVCLLAVDLVTGFGRWSRYSSVLRGLALVAGLALSTIAVVQGLRPPEVVPYDVTLEGLPGALEGTVIVAVSDLHLGSRLDEQWLNARIDQIEAEQPDLILLLGDIYEGHGEPVLALKAALARLQAPLGVWAVLGNHEFHRGGEPKAATFAGNGFTVLRNSWAEVAKGLIVAGVDDLTNGKRNGHGSKALHQALAGRPSGATLLLSHSPLYAAEAAAAGCGLMLSGHTHGGQLWPFDYLVQQRYPLLEGRYQEGDMIIVVSRGTGTWGPRMRLWPPGEISRVTLHARKKVSSS